MPEGPWVRQAIPGDSRLGPRAHVVDQLSRTTRAQVRGHVGSTGSHGELGPGSEGMCGQPAVLRDSGLCPRARQVHQLPQGTRARVRGKRGRPSVPGHLGPGPWAHGYDQLTRGNCALILWPAVFTSSPGRFEPLPEGPQDQQTVLGDLGSRPRFRSVDLLSRALGPVGLTSCPGPIALGSESPRGRLAVLGHSGPGPSTHGLNQISWVTRSWVRGPAVLTNSHG